MSLTCGNAFISNKNLTFYKIVAHVFLYFNGYFPNCANLHNFLVMFTNGNSRNWKIMGYDEILGMTHGMNKASNLHTLEF